MVPDGARLLISFHKGGFEKLLPIDLTDANVHGFFVHLGCKFFEFFFAMKGVCQKGNSNRVCVAMPFSSLRSENHVK